MNMNIEKRKYIIIGVIFLVFIFFVWQTDRQVNQNVKPAPTVAPQQASPQSVIGIKTSDGKTLYKPGEPIKILIYASSVSAIADYDVVVNYPKNLSYVGLNNLIPDYQVVTTNETKGNNNKLFITGGLKLGKNPALPFSDTGLLTLQFAPTGSGKVQISLDFEKGETTESNLIDQNSRDTLDGVDNSPLTIYTGARTVRIETGKSLTDSKTGLKFNLIEVNVARPNCMDCGSGAKMIVKSGDQTQTLEFVSGTLTGQISGMKTVFDTGIEVEKFEKDGVVLRIGR